MSASLLSAARAALNVLDATGAQAEANALRTALSEAEKAQPVAFAILDHGVVRYLNDDKFDTEQELANYGGRTGMALVPLYAAPQPVSESRDWKADFGEMQAHCAHLETELRHLRKAQPVAVPAGWKLVPVEPTQEMLAAYVNLSTRFSSARADWAAMLAAAPAAPAPQPLTDAALRQLAYDTDAAGNSVIEYGRAIERAHGIC